MQVRFSYEGKWIVPYFICETCGKRLVDSRDAIVNYKPDNSAPVLITHRGKCDPGPSPISGYNWRPLDGFLVNLLATTNTDLKKTIKRERKFHCLL